MSESLVLIANAGDGTISAFAFDAAGEAASLRPLATTGDLPGCGTFAVDPDRNRVYAAVKGEPARVVTLDLDRISGEMTKVAEQPVESSMAYLALTPDGRVLLGASYGGGVGLTWAVRDGHLSEPVSRVEYPNAHCIVTAGDGRFAYLVALGADLVAQFALDGEGRLHPLDPPTLPFAPDAGPRHLVFSADERTGYLMTEYTGELYRLSRDPDTGLLTSAESVRAYNTELGLADSHLGADPLEEPLVWGADVHLAGTAGEWVVASERSGSTLATVAVDGDGRLGEVVALTPTLRQPRGFATSPDGRWLVAVGEKATDAVVYRVGEAGALVDVSRAPTGNGANWVRFVH